MLIKQRKIIQICPSGIHSTMLCALCDDGTVWEREVVNGKDYEWFEVDTTKITHKETPGTEEMVVTVKGMPEFIMHQLSEPAEIRGEDVNVFFKDRNNLDTDVMLTVKDICVGESIFSKNRFMRFRITNKEKDASGLYKYVLVNEEAFR